MSEDSEVDYDELRQSRLSDLDDIHSTLEEILSELKGRSIPSGAIFFGIFVFFALVTWGDSRWEKWTERLWYSMKYDTSMNNVIFEKRPLDCNFLHAPLGGKGCEYKKGFIVFGPEQRTVLVNQATTQEEKRRALQMPNSVTVSWEKETY